MRLTFPHHYSSKTYTLCVSHQKFFSLQKNGFDEYTLQRTQFLKTKRDFCSETSELQLWEFGKLFVSFLMHSYTIAKNNILTWAVGTSMWNTKVSVKCEHRSLNFIYFSKNKCEKKLKFLFEIIPPFGSCLDYHIRATCGLARPPNIFMSLHKSERYNELLYEAELILQSALQLCSRYQSIITYHLCENPR